MANTGGKIHVAQPIMFADEVISIGDVLTDATSGVTQGAVIGSGASAQGPRSVVVGAGAGAVSSGDHSVVLGYQARSQFGAPTSITIGAGAVSQFGATSSINIGHSNQMRGGTQYVAIGTFRSGLSNIGSSVYLGTGDTSAASISNGLSIGCFALTETGSGYTLIGGATVSGSGASDHVVIGEGALATSGGASVVIGEGAQGISSQQLVIGGGAQVNNGTSDGVSIGYHATCLGYGGISIGASASIGIGADLSVAIGQLASVSGASGAIAIGSNATIATGSDAIVIGYNSSATNAPYSIAVGSNAVATADTCIAFGPSARVGSQYALSIGSGIIDNLSVQSVSLGYDGHVTNSPYSILYSAFNLPSQITDVVGYSTCIGYSSSINLASYSLALGAAVQINDAAITDPSRFGAHVTIGQNCTLSDGTEGSSTLGQSIALLRSSQSIVMGEAHSVTDGNYTVVVGRNNTLTTSVDNAIVIGIYQTAIAAQTITLGSFTYNTVANSMEIGTSNSHVAPNVPAGGAAIHSMTVKGFNGAALNTVEVTDNPVTNGDTGLSLVCNLGGIFSNKIVKSLETPAVGALYLYIIP